MSVIFQDRAFLIHFAIYAVVNAILIAVNLATSPDHLWFYWPLLGWGIGLAAHGWGVYRRVTNPSQEDIVRDRLRERERAGRS